MKILHAATLLAFLLHCFCSHSRAATVVWQFWQLPENPFESIATGKPYEVRAKIYGDDHRGIAGFDFHFEDKFGFDDIEPNQLRFFPIGHPTSDFQLQSETTEGEIWTASYETTLSQAVEAVTETELGVMLIPENAFFPFSSFDESTVTLFDLDATDTLPANQISYDSRTSDFHVDGDFYLIGHNVDFGEVTVNEVIFSDIVVLEFIGFLGNVELRSATLTGPDAENFAIVDFEPTTLGGLQHFIPYDIAFTPDRPGSFQATLELEYTTEVDFGPEPLTRSVQLRGVFVPEPNNLATLAVLCGLTVCRAQNRSRRKQFLSDGRASAPL